MFFFSCGDDDSDSLLSPPGWIIGVWATDPESVLTREFTFTEDNVLLSNGTDVFDFTEATISNSGELDELESSSDIYSFRLAGEGWTERHTFNRNDDLIDYLFVRNEVFMVNHELFRQ